MRHLLLVLVLAGCKGHPQTNPQAHLTVMKGGKPVAMQGAIAAQLPGGGLAIRASSAPLGCADITEAYVIKPDAIDLDLQTGAQLQADGTTRTMLTRIIGVQGEPVPVKLAGDGAAGGKVTLDVDVDASWTGLTAKGTIEAIGCGPTTYKPSEPVAPAMPATITIAGKKLPVRGARWDGDSGYIELATGDACKHDGELMVALAYANKTTSPDVFIRGSLIHETRDTKIARREVTLSPAQPTGPGALDVHADLVVDDYPIQIDGHVTTIACH